MTSAVEIYTETSSLTWRNKVTPRLQVWYSTTVVYQFFINSDFHPSYAKSTDAGATWGSPVVLMTPGSYIDMDIYYERWHDTGNDPIVHVIGHRDTGDSFPLTGGRGIYYNNIDLSTDTLQTATGTQLTAGSAEPNSGPYCVGCALNEDVMVIVGGQGRLSTDGGTSFSTVTSVNEGIRDNFVIWPDAFSGDTADMIAIGTDDSDTTMRAIQWDSSGSVWTNAVVIDADTQGSPQPISMNFTTAYKRSSGKIMIAHFQSNGTTATLFTWTMEGTGTVTARTNVLTDVAIGANGYYNAALTVTSTGDVICAYVRAGLVYYKKSTDDMSTWGAETLYSTEPAHVINNIFADPAPGVALYMPAYLFNTENPDNSSIWVEVPAVNEATVALTGTITITFTLSGVLTGGAPSNPPIMLKCAPVDGFAVINVPFVDSRN